MLLTHQAGLPYPTEACTLDDVLGWDGVVDKLARSSTQWEPGTAHGYHAVTYGFLVGEVLRRITGRSVGTLFRDELAGPLGLDSWIGLPAEHEPRVAPLVGGLTPDVPADADPALKALVEQFVGPDTLLGRALTCHGGLSSAEGTNVFNTREVRAAEIPAANGVTDARSLSRLYAAVIGDVHADERFPAGRRLLARNRRRRRHQADRRQRPGADGRDDLRPRVHGVVAVRALWRGPLVRARGRGRVGRVRRSRTHGLGFGYVMSKMQTNLSGDPRTRSLVRAIYDAAGAPIVHG